MIKFWWHLTLTFDLEIYSSTSAWPDTPCLKDVDSPRSKRCEGKSIFLWQGVTDHNVCFLRHMVNSALHPSGVAKSSTSFGWGKGGKVTSAEWQVTLCDLIWHVISRSGVVISITNCYIRFTLLLLYSLMVLCIRWYIVFSGDIHDIVGCLLTTVFARCRWQDHTRAWYKKLTSSHSVDSSRQSLSFYRAIIFSCCLQNSSLISTWPCHLRPKPSNFLRCRSRPSFRRIVSWSCFSVGFCSTSTSPANCSCSVRPARRLDRA